MANKQTKRNRLKVRKAGKAGNPSVDIQRPVRDYHNHEHTTLTTKAFPTATVGKDGLVSCNRRKNMAMRVLRNTDGAGQKISLTVHEPLKHDYIVLRNHKYLKEDKRGNPYHQPRIHTPSSPVAA